MSTLFSECLKVKGVTSDSSLHVVGHFVLHEHLNLQTEIRIQASDHSNCRINGNIHRYVQI